MSVVERERLRDEEPMENLNSPARVYQVCFSTDQMDMSLARRGNVSVWDSPAAYFSLQKPRRRREGWSDSESGKVRYWKNERVGRVGQSTEPFPPSLFFLRLLTI